MRSAIKLALASRLVVAEAIEASSFPQLARQYQVWAVPKTVVNDRVAVDGAVPDEVLWSAIAQALGIPPDGAAEGGAPSRGAAGPDAPPPNGQPAEDAAPPDGAPPQRQPESQ